MKTFALLPLLLAITTTAFSQIKKGQFLAGGSISFESTKNENSINPTFERKTFFVSPNIGYFIIDKMAGGVRVDIASYNNKSANLETHQTVSSISPFLRYYVLPVAKKVNAFIDISYIHNKSKWSSDTNPGYYEKARGYSLTAGPSIFLTDQIALEFTVGYKHSNSDNYGATEVNTFSSGLGLQIHFGKSKSKSKT